MANHFHIQWSSTGKPDWERFENTLEASQRADQLVRPDETYKIEEFGENCPVCPRHSH